MIVRQMIAPTGAAIIAILEVVKVTARIEPLTREDGHTGELNVVLTGDNAIDPSSQNPLRDNGQRIFVCENAQLWHESSLVPKQVIIQ